MDMKEQRKNGITEGVIWKQLLVFFFPIMIGTFFQQLYNTVDSVVVGNFAGKEALSCVGGSSGQIINFVVGFFTGLSAGATVVISQHFGAQNERALDKALHTAYAFAVWGGILAGIAGIAATPAVMRMMNTPQELMRDSILYVRVYFAGLIFIFIYNMGSAILRAIGDAKRPLYYLMVCSVINIVLDLLFVLQLHMGVLGVAVATMISQAVSALLVTLALMWHTEGLKLQFRKIRIHWDMFGGMLMIGLPTGIQSSMYSISNIIVQSSLNNLGVDSMAAWAAFGKIDSLYWMINGAFGIAVTTFVGQNYGAGKWDRVKRGTRVCLGMALAVSIVVSTGIILAGEFLLGLFVADEAVIEIGMQIIRMIPPSFFLFAFIEIFSGSLRAQGHVAVTTIMTLTCVCLLRIVWIVWIVPGGNLQQLLFCYPLTWLICAAAMIPYYIYKQRAILKKLVPSS